MDLARFVKHGTSSSYKKGCRCAECRTAARDAARVYRSSNRDRVRKQSRKSDLLRLYGLLPWQVDEMRAQQGGACGICGEQLADGKRMHVDHDPATGRVRGLLCIGCNSGLGKLGDSIDGIRRALAYLERAAAAPSEGPGSVPPCR